MAAVLIVEDDPGVRDMIARAFMSRGWSVGAAATPGEARQLASARSFDLILCDVMLPETNGVALAEQLRELQPGASVTFISGYPEQYLRNTIGLQSDLPLLQKPFPFKTLIGRAGRLTAVRPEGALPDFGRI